MREKIYKVAACICVMVLLLSSIAYAADEDSFSCYYDQDTKTVTVDGAGAVPDCYSNGLQNPNVENAPVHPEPWYVYHDVATDLIVKSGITRLGKYSFSAYTALEKIVIENPDMEIADGALPGYSSGITPVVYGYAMSTAELFASEEGYEFAFLGEPQYGDMSGNGQYDVADALLVLKLVAGSGENYRFTADFDQDGAATVADALGILKMVAN